jgi:hypothetical protein
LLKLRLLFAKKLITTLDFKKNANFFRRKLAKIAENCDHNIDPCTSESIKARPFQR